MAVRKFRMVSQVLPAGLLALFVRLIYPWRRVRVIPTHSQRIGHFSANNEIYLSERDLGCHPSDCIDVFYHQKEICNLQLKKMWDREFFILPHLKFLDYFQLINAKLGRPERFHLKTTDRDVDGLLNITAPHIRFLSGEEDRGRMGLEAMGIGADDRFICFMSRDSSYLNDVHPELNWEYHDYRNSSIVNYMSAAEEMVKRGYRCLRMGAVVDRPLDDPPERIIDYAAKHRSDFLDIYLGAKCRFLLSDTSGFHAVPLVFRRPRIIANQVPLEYLPSWGPNDLILPKKYWLRNENRYMTFREIMTSDAARASHTGLFEEMGIELIENTPEEISAIAIEMDERLQGTWVADEEDRELQDRFWEIFGTGKYNKVIAARIGAGFLKENRHLLD